jgi:hypothetical protein
MSRAATVGLADDDQRDGEGVGCSRRRGVSGFEISMMSGGYVAATLDAFRERHGMEAPISGAAFFNCLGRYANRGGRTVS